MDLDHVDMDTQELWVFSVLYGGAQTTHPKK